MGTTTMSTRARKAAERKAHDARMAEIRERNAKIIAGGKCPQCGLPLRRNLALTDWWQCAAYGEPYFRPVEFRDAPKCSFQI